MHERVNSMMGNSQINPVYLTALHNYNHKYIIIMKWKLWGREDTISRIYEKLISKERKNKPLKSLFKKFQKF